MELKSYWL